MNPENTHTKIVKSSGNVFEDLGFEKEEAANMKMRALLALQIRDYVEGQNLTQKAAAERFKVAQPDISAICSGKIGRVTVDKLINMLTRVGYTLNISTKSERPTFTLIYGTGGARSSSTRSPSPTSKRASFRDPFPASKVATARIGGSASPRKAARKKKVG